MKKEIWKDIPEYEGLYQVSNLGNVKSLDTNKQYIRNNSIVNIKNKGKILKSRVNKDGYKYVIFSHNSNRKTLKNHRLVAICFLKNENNYPFVNHIDGNKQNNIVSNLEWCTSKENKQHSLRIGTSKGVRGEKSHLSKLNKNQVEKIRKMYKEDNVSQEFIAKKFNISQSQVGRIVRGVNWLKESENEDDEETGGFLG